LKSERLFRDANFSYNQLKDVTFFVFDQSKPANLKWSLTLNWDVDSTKGFFIQSISIDSSSELTKFGLEWQTLPCNFQGVWV